MTYSLLAIMITYALLIIVALAGLVRSRLLAAQVDELRAQLAKEIQS